MTVAIKDLPIDLRGYTNIELYTLFPPDSNIPPTM